MKQPKIFKLLLIVLMLFFSLQLTSHIFLKLGLNKETPPRSGLLKVSAAVFPLDAELIYEHAFALLEEHAYLKGADRPKLNNSVNGFKRAIGLNPLLYNAHFNLGKAYQLAQDNESTLYDDAFKFLKRAAFIRGNRAHISVEVIKQLLSLWPFLNHEDKEFCQHLMVKSIPGMSNADFTAILNVWGIYSKDIEMLKKALVKKPQFYREISKKLEQLELDMEARQEFLAGYEDYYLDYFQKRFPDYLKKSTDKLKTLRSWKRRLKNSIPGYFKLIKNSNFNLSLYRELKQTLIKKSIDFLFKENKNKLGDTILSYINECDSGENINQIYQFLKKKNFFDEPDLKKRFLEILIYSKMGGWNRVIQRGEDIRQSMSFVREDQKEDYAKILMLLVEGYLKTNQIEQAEVVLLEVEKISPESDEVGWLKCKMLHVRSHISDVKKGAEDPGDRRQEIEGRKSEARNSKFETSTNDQNTNDINISQDPGDRRQEGEEGKSEIRNPKSETKTINQEIEDRSQESEGKEEKIKNSRIIDLKSTRFKKTVYFMDDSVLVLNLSEAFKEKIKDKHLLQVFVDGWIYYEQYLGKVKEEVEVKVGDGEWKKVEVEVRIR